MSKNKDGFIDIPFESANLDRYYIRRSVLLALQEALPFFSGALLDVGCGKMPYKKYIMEYSSVKQYTGLDLEGAIVYDKAIKADLFWDGERMPVQDSTFDTVLATEVLEHCPAPEKVLLEIHRVMKSGGIFFFTVPFLWNLHEVPNDAYRYTPFILQRLLNQSGFSEVTIKSTGGWHASMAQMLGLWVRRSPMPKSTRKILSVMLKPLILFLIRKDGSPNKKFSEGQMITGLYGWSKK